MQPETAPYTRISNFIGGRDKGEMLKGREGGVMKPVEK
jgi:hypothetical protein